jgi:hypothetical protein
MLERGRHNQAMKYSFRWYWYNLKTRTASSHWAFLGAHFVSTSWPWSLQVAGGGSHTQAGVCYRRQRKKLQQYHHKIPLQIMGYLLSPPSFLQFSESLSSYFLCPIHWAPIVQGLEYRSHIHPIQGFGVTGTGITWNVLSLSHH